MHARVSACVCVSGRETGRQAACAFVRHAAYNHKPQTLTPRCRNRPGAQAWLEGNHEENLKAMGYTIFRFSAHVCTFRVCMITRQTQTLICGLAVSGLAHAH